MRSGEAKKDTTTVFAVVISWKSAATYTGIRKPTIFTCVVQV